MAEFFSETSIEPAVIEVYVKSVYGKDLIYPRNQGAKVLASIAGTKTLSPEVLRKAIDLGLVVKEVPNPVVMHPELSPGYGGRTFR